MQIMVLSIEHGADGIALAGSRCYRHDPVARKRALLGARRSISFRPAPEVAYQSPPANHSHHATESPKVVQSPKAPPYRW